MQRLNNVSLVRKMSSNEWIPSVRNWFRWKIKGVSLQCLHDCLRVIRIPRKRWIYWIRLASSRNCWAFHLFVGVEGRARQLWLLSNVAELFMMFTMWTERIVVSQSLSPSHRANDCDIFISHLSWLFKERKRFSREKSKAKSLNFHSICSASSAPSITSIFNGFILFFCGYEWRVEWTRVLEGDERGWSMKG